MAMALTTGDRSSVSRLDRYPEEDPVRRRLDAHTSRGPQGAMSAADRWTKGRARVSPVLPALASYVASPDDGGGDDAFPIMSEGRRLQVDSAASDCSMGTLQALSLEMRANISTMVDELYAKKAECAGYAGQVPSSSLTAADANTSSYFLSPA
jgi:hypothetical protein